MLNFQQRMVQELRLLKEKCEKVERFLDTDKYDDLADADQVLLLAQSVHMVGYCTFLQERVDRLPEPDPSLLPVNA